MQIETPRLILRWLRANDLEDFLEYRSDPTVMRYQSMSPMTREEAVSFIRSQSGNSLDRIGGYQQLGVELKNEGKLIGDCALKRTTAQPRIAELGYTINRRFQGMGYATEAVGALAGLLFSKLDVHKVVALVDVRNPASFRVLEKLNFTREAHLRKSYFDDVDGDWFDEYWYGLLKEEWG
ncbi:MAG: GNAT family N-acetyltransferase [Lewinellaceae bacterium]|nr:GNAT family N-acetyltransferase [Lewinellaceae bacterium]